MGRSFRKASEEESQHFSKGSWSHHVYISFLIFPIINEYIFVVKTMKNRVKYKEKFWLFMFHPGSEPLLTF